MNVSFKQVLESCQRVLDFLGTYPPPRPAAAYAGHRKAIEEIVGQIVQSMAEQAAGTDQSRGETVRHRQARKALREDHLEPIVRVARALAFDIPGLDQAVTLPSEKLSSVKLMAAAKSIRDTVAPLAPQFIANGLAQDFLVQLDGATEAVRLAALRRAATRGRHIGARKALQLEMKNAGRVVRLLDAHVRTAFKGNVGVLARWRAAKRVQRPAGGYRPPQQAQAA